MTRNTCPACGYCGPLGFLTPCDKGKRPPLPAADLMGHTCNAFAPSAAACGVDAEGTRLATGRIGGRKSIGYALRRRKVTKDGEPIAASRAETAAVAWAASQGIPWEEIRGSYGLTRDRIACVRHLLKLGYSHDASAHALGIGWRSLPRLKVLTARAEADSLQAEV